MNDHPTSVFGHRADIAAAGPTDRPLPPPWGFLATSGWVLLAFALGAGVLGAGIIWLNWGHFDSMPDTQEDPWFPLQFIVVNLVQVAVLAAAVRWRGWPIGLYLGLVRPRGRDFLDGIVVVALAMVALEVLTHLLDRASVPPFQTDSYRAARAAGQLAALWLAFVLVAPIAEEIVFRGFVFRGWTASRLGAAWTILLTSLIFAAAHTQYDWFGTFQTFCIGALFGWLRWRSGSTLVTILLHMAINLVSTAWTAAKVEGLV